MKYLFIYKVSCCCCGICFWTLIYISLDSENHSRYRHREVTRCSKEMIIQHKSGIIRKNFLLEQNLCMLLIYD